MTDSNNITVIKRPTPPDIETELVIIGAGVTGLTVAKQLTKTDIDFWILGSPYESQLAKAGELKDTSLPEGTIGLKFMEKIFEALKEEEVNHRSSLCTGISIKGDKYLVETKFQNFVTSNILIATGNKQKSLGFEGEEEYFRKGISDCTVCDFPLFREKPVAVIGNHEYTQRAAELMKKHTNSVALLWYKANDVPELEGIDTFANVRNLKASGDESLTHLEFEHDGGKTTLEIQGLFVEGEPVPSTAFLEGFDLDLEQNYIAIDKQFKTNRDNIWAAGDITGKSSSYDEAKDHGLKVAEIIIQELR